MRVRSSLVTLVIAAGTVVGCAPAYNADRWATPLHWAAEYRSPRQVQNIIDGGEVDIDARDKYGRTPLLLAVKRARPRNADVLLNAGCDVDAGEHRGRSPLMDAAITRIRGAHGFFHDPEDVYATMRRLLAADPDLEARDQEGRTALMWAAWKGDLERVRMLLESGADPNNVDHEGKTPLMWAVGHRNRICEFLIEQGADPHARDGAGRNALMWAARSDRFWVQRSPIQVLVAAGVDIEAVDERGWTALAYAAEDGKRRTLRTLLDAGADPTALGWTAAHRYAAAGYAQELAASLGGNEYQARDMWGRTPLMWASHFSYSPNEMRVLIDAASDLEAKDNDGRTALILAARFAYVGEIRKLAVAGADIQATDNEGKTALIHAVQRRAGLNVAKLLVELGADFDAAGPQGATALMYAAAHARSRSVELLLEAGASVEAQDHQGRSALDYAQLNPWGDRWHIAKLLDQAGSSEPDRR